MLRIAARRRSATCRSPAAEQRPQDDSSCGASARTNRAQGLCSVAQQRTTEASFGRRKEASGFVGLPLTWLGVPVGDDGVPVNCSGELIMNPYQPPSCDEVSTRTRTNPYRIASVILVTASFLVYYAFTIILITAGSSDRSLGLLLLLNWPLLAVWLYRLRWNASRTFSMGFRCAGMQLVIMFAILLLGMGGFLEVFLVNTWIALGFCVVTMICWRAAQHRLGDFQA